MVPCVKQVTDMITFIVYFERVNSWKWVILLCFDFTSVSYMLYQLLMNE